MEVPCQLKLNCSNKEQMKRLKELLNLYLLKVFSSICDKNKPIYSLLNQWSRVLYKPHPRFFTQNLSKKGAAYTRVFTVFSLNCSQIDKEALCSENVPSIHLWKVLCGLH